MFQKSSSQQNLKKKTFKKKKFHWSNIQEKERDIWINLRQNKMAAAQ